MNARIHTALAAALVLAGTALSQSLLVPVGLVAKSPSLAPPVVLLTWNHPGAVLYKIYRSPGDSLHFAWVGVSPTRSYEDTGVAPGKLYYYAVSALGFQDSLLVESGRSIAARVSTQPLPGGPKGILAGRVVDESNGQPIARAPIRASRLDAALASLYAALTDSLGRFRVVVDTGRYVLRIEPPGPNAAASGYRGEWYNNAAEPQLATPLRIGVGDSIGIAVSLARQGPAQYAYINGTIRDTTGAPMSAASVAVFRSLQSMAQLAPFTSTGIGTGPEAVVLPGLGFARGVVWKGFTNAGGEYHAQVPNGGVYIVETWREGYRPVFFGGTPDPTRARILFMHGDTSGVDITLRLQPVFPGKIRGTVRDSLGSGIAGRVILFPRPKETVIETPVFSVHTDELGSFEVDNVPAGTYSLLTIPYSDYAPTYYKSGSYNAVNWQQADTLRVNGTSVNDIAIGTAPVSSTGAVRISGTVRSAVNGPLTGTRLVALTGSRLIGYAISDGAGQFAIEALSPGAIGLAVDMPGFASLQAPVVIPPGLLSVSGLSYVLAPGSTVSVSGVEHQPPMFALMQNYPNPFNPATSITFEIPAPGHVSLLVYDLLGREVATLLHGVMAAGRTTVVFDASQLSSGVYLYRLTVGGRTETRTMMLLR